MLNHDTPLKSGVLSIHFLHPACPQDEIRVMQSASRLSFLQLVVLLVPGNHGNSSNIGTRI